MDIAGRIAAVQIMTEAVKKKDCLERWNVECVNSQSRNLALKKCTEDPTWTSSLFV